MSSPPLTSERITQLALELAMVSSQRTVGLADVQYQQLERALKWHRDSCRPVRVARRLQQALFSHRLSNCVALIAQQKAMLRLAADDGSDEGAVLDALVQLSNGLLQFELGPNATPKQQLALAACEIPEVRARFAVLVRTGDITSTPDGLKLMRTSRRRIAAYSALGMLAGWPALLFITMSIDGKLALVQLASYLVGSIVFSAWLTRSLFTELQSDEHTVRDLNAQLKPRPVAGKQTAK